MDKILGEKPLYSQIMETIRGKISSEEWAPGQRIPSEAELGQHFGVSRICIRQAIAGLKSDGFVFSIQGKGTFVSNTTKSEGWTRLSTFTSQYRSGWASIGAVTLSVEQVEVPDDAVDFFGVRKGELVICIRRVRTIAGSPVIVQYHYISPNVPHKVFYENRNFVSFTRLLSEQAGIVVKHAKDTVRVTLSSVTDSHALGIRPNTPLLQIKRFARDQGFNPVEYREVLVLSDVWPYEVEVSL